ncbi:alkaline phosphatase [uncultured Thiocystis sp.]|jgi:hypothetical protein|uniref:alkaline phosphatase n=1 Tax=uncultured Thiocystis sp. TaxID=1202134 RepID=UPI0025E1089B|nr:alkaline phosphatase [uncultured Thiocystis sp.]
MIDAVVRIIVDDLGLSRIADAESVTSPDVNLIHALRERIRQRLRVPLPEPLVLCMSSAIYQRFANLEGQPGLTVERLSPRPFLRERLGCPLPVWLTDPLAVMLLALAGDHAATEGDPIDRILTLIDPALAQTLDLATILDRLSRQPLASKALLDVPEIRARLRDRLAAAGLTAAAELLNLFFDSNQAPMECYRLLALAQLRDRLESLCVRDGLAPETALPPRLCSSELARQLPILPVVAEQAAPYPAYLRNLLILAERRTHGDGLPVERLAEYVAQDWPELCESLQTLFEQNPALASEPLILALRRLDNELARDLAVRMRDALDHAHCDPLPATASVKEVLRWSERYFDYARGAFERHAEPDEAVCRSFARWVTAEPHRIIQSDHDWRTVARTVDELLAAGQVVILCVVDALGAIHLDLVELALRQRLVDQSVPVIKPLFAPLPTITEVGKIGVLTGAEPGTQPTDYDRALRARFAAHLGPDGLQIVKSWKDFRQALQPTTRLLVCLDNRVDDDLHQCTEFRHHRERVRTVAEQLAELIAGWQLDAAHHQRQAAILITADHGATKVSRRATEPPGTTPLERRLLRVDAAPDPVPEGMIFVPAHPGGYLIPHDRVAYGPTETLLHGGLTPEEVLIPFILITRQDRGAVAALQLTPIETRAHAATEGWYVRLCLVNRTRETFINLKIVAQAPFSGDSPVFPRLDPQDRIEEVILNLRASIEQQGPTQVSFELRYQEGAAASYQRRLFQFDLDLAGHLLERTEAAEQFDNFFDL